MHRNQRRRAGRVDGYRRPCEPEQVGNSPRQGVAPAPQCHREVELFGMQEKPLLEVRNPLADEHANPAAPEAQGIETSILECFPRSFQQQALLRIYPLGLARRQTKELGVELVDIRQVAAIPDAHLPRHPQGGIVVPLQVDAAFGNVADRLALIPQHRQKGSVRADATGIPAADPDNSKRNTETPLIAVRIVGHFLHFLPGSPWGRVSRPSAFAHTCAQCPEFDWVIDKSSSSVRLDVSNLTGTASSVAVSAW